MAPARDRRLPSKQLTSRRRLKHGMSSATSICRRCRTWLRLRPWSMSRIARLPSSTRYPTKLSPPLQPSNRGRCSQPRVAGTATGRCGCSASPRSGPVSPRRVRAAPRSCRCPAALEPRNVARNVKSPPLPSVVAAPQSSGNCPLPPASRFRRPRLLPPLRWLKSRRSPARSSSHP